MISTSALGWPGSAGGSSRRLAAGLLFAAWGLAVAASDLGSPAHELAPRVVTAFLLWRTWRGAAWSRYLLLGWSCVSAGFAIGLSVGIVLGASGIVSSAVAMFALYAGVGVLLAMPAVRGLAQADLPPARCVPSLRR